ncbi:single-stranded-DNA-specific exonuclease RecJ [Niallia nealsonii]|uniref:Single-stranded-DNA-specific exonuclease RecJ n=1 Tax=Niallia nealsonii TaxID=115979 RepID=A0A2N0Z4J8_9BACI|nr:single-stranded-DNA-specific exonuclease RecJ [Niallia nealsonii]PKG24432.1 single-stranded-DNA-specific exonuclease RecJ [Niallia nealsonii]
MLQSKTRWITHIDNQTDDIIAEFVQHLNITPLVASLLINRGYRTVGEAKDFLFAQNQDFYDPYLLLNMETAVERIRTAINNQEKILVFGDYDADGVTSTTVMMKTLEEMGADVEFYIPNRFTEGYGPNEGAFRYAKSIGIDLIITVDTGIAAVHEADVAKELGIDLIITDHHEPSPILPDAYCIIHPKIPGSDYPFGELAGVGVAFKVAHALYGYVPEHLLPFVAIGTIADLVSLTGENRLIAKQGIKKLQQTDNVGLKALLKQMNTDSNVIDEETIGFMIAPRINAVGRLGSADPAVDLLMTSDKEMAMELAMEMEETNKERQDIVNQITEEAIAQVDELYPLAENRVLIVGKEGWNAGVVGIVASRLVEKYCRPTIVLSLDQNKQIAKGSARSIAGFDLYKNLSTARDILPHFGGHPMAAGMTLALGDVDLLRQRLNELAFEQLQEEDLIPLTKVDGSFMLEEVQLKTIEQMQLLAPFGVDNAKPKVILKDMEIAAIRKIGANQNHLKMQLKQGENSLDGIGFGIGEWHEHISPSAKVSVLGQLAINEWNNIKKPQIFIQDLMIDKWQLFDYRGALQLEKLVAKMPVEDALWIFFHQDSVTSAFKSKVSNYKIVETIEEAAFFYSKEPNIVLADFPTDIEIINRLLSNITPERIYAVFYKGESDFFSTMPTRDHFKWYYAFLAKQKSFHLDKFGGELAKRKGWSKETIVFMTKVFFELNFVTMEDGFILLSKNTAKRDLTESPSFQQKQAQFTLENELIYSSYEQLKNWFDLILKKSVNNEEEVKEWI